MSNPQAQGSQGPTQPPQMLKADDVGKLQHLNDDLKQKYRAILQNFWAMLQTKPQGSPEHQGARAKLQEWSQKLIVQERAYRARLKQMDPANQQNQQNPQPPQPGSGSGNDQQSPPQPTQQQKPQPPAQQPPNPGQPAQPGQARPQGTNAQINPEIIKHVQTFNYHLPLSGPHAGTPEGDAKIKEFRNNYLMALNKQEKATHRVKAYANMIEQRQKAGQEIPPELLSQKQQVELEYNSAKEFVENFRKRQTQWKREQEQRRAQQQQQPQGQGQQTQPPIQPQRPPSQTNNVKEEPHIKIEGGQASQQGHQFGNMSGPGGAPQQPPPQNTQVTAPSVTQQPPRQPPAPHSQQLQQPNQGSTFTQPGQPQSHQQRPQINPIATNQQHQAQSNSPHPPQSATSNPAGPLVPLSHQAAVSAAQRSYSNTDPQRTATPIQTGSQGSFHAPGSREREQLNNPKLPIPRTLNVTQPTPVGMGQARPTMSGPTNGAPGPMGQPVITKFPPFQLEGEGDRVLSKRKLDELVRQVTGGAEEALTPEVEEAILQLADDFVDTVIGSACKLSKLRESPQLDIRDIQLVLERNYNIRIPGYASDEVRTVRKLVPAPGWTQKMNAVQAAKVMGGKTDI